MLFILGAFITVNNFFLFRVEVQGASMQPTFYTGDVVAASYYAKPTRYSIVVITGEKSNGEWLIKRAIAFGGETVMIKDGYVYLKEAGAEDFRKLEENYLRKQGITYYPNVNNPRDTAEKIFTVGEGEIFYLGDNRTNSSDSRSDFGTCSEKQIVGVVSEFAVKMKNVTKFLENLTKPLKKLMG